MRDRRLPVESSADGPSRTSMKTLRSSVGTCLFEAHLNVGEMHIGIA
jgi:hypothetical protein